MPHLPDHQTDHDPLLIAAFASGDAEGADLERARDLVAACDDCAALHRDLRAIAAAVPALPARARSRDFRLTPEQAASLRPAGWRRLLVPLAGPRFAFAAPLGGSLAALGIAGILVAGAAGMPLLSGATGTRDLAAPVAGAGAGAATPSITQVELDRANAQASSLPAAAQQPEGQPVPSEVAVDTSAASPAPSGETLGRTSTGDQIYSSGGGTTQIGTKATDAAGLPAPQEGNEVVTVTAPLTSDLVGTSPLASIAVLALVVGSLLLIVRITARRVA